MNLRLYRIKKIDKSWCQNLFYDKDDNIRRKEKNKKFMKIKIKYRKT